MNDQGDDKKEKKGKVQGNIHKPVALQGNLPEPEKITESSVVSHKQLDLFFLIRVRGTVQPG